MKHALVVVEEELLHVMTEEEEEDEEEGISGMFPLALVDLCLQRLDFSLVVEGEEDEEMVTLLFEDCSRQSVMVVEQEVLILGVLEIFPSQQRHHPTSL